MIQKIKDRFRDHPTWLGVTVGLTIILVASVSISVVSGWYLAERVAKQTAVDEVNVAVGKRIDELGKILDGFKKLEMTQTQNVNVGRDKEAEIDKNARDILAKKGLIHAD